MKASCGNLKIPGDDLSPWRVMALVAQPKQVAFSKFSRTAQKLIQSMKKWDILRVYKASAPINWTFEIYFKTLLYTLLVEKILSNIQTVNDSMNFWIAYLFLKQNQAILHWENINNQWPSNYASPLPGPVKSKLDKDGLRNIKIVPIA